MTEQEAIYSTETPEDPESRDKETTNMVRNLALDHMLEHRFTFESSFGTDQIAAVNETDSATEEVLVTEMERDTDSAPDLDLDSHCRRMRSEIAQGDELTIRAAAWALQINIRVLKLNSYPGTPLDPGEVPDTLNSPESDAQGLRTITIAHYTCQHGGAGHYNPIFQQKKDDDSLEEMDTVDNEESPDSGSHELGESSEPVATSAIRDAEKAKSLDQ